MRSSIPRPALIVLACIGPALARADPSPALGAGPSKVEEVVVTAQRAKSQVLIDRKVYVVSGNLQTTTGSAADVLNEVPSVDVDADGALSLRGDPHVTILVDGKPSAQLSGASAGLALQQFPAAQIDRIEVMTSPPAQYKAAGSAGVINIITKRGRRDGFSGAARANVGQFGRAVAGIDATYNAGGLSLTGGVGLRRDIRDRRTTSDRTESDPIGGAATRTDERIDEHFHRLTPSLNGGVEDKLNNRQTFGLSFSRVDLTGRRYFDQTDLSGPPGAPEQTVSARFSDGHERHIDTSEKAHFDQALWRPGETASLSLQRSHTSEQEGYAYRNISVVPAAAPTFDDLHLGLELAKTEVNLDYDLPLSANADFKLGYDFEADDNNFNNIGHTIDASTGERTVDPKVTNDFRYRQTVNAIYAVYAQPLGQWSLQAGLRAEATSASWRQITADIPGGRRDFDLYPSLHADRALGDKAKLSLDLSRRVTRPDPEALNPFSDHQDTYNLRAGNPKLKPQDTWLAELGYAVTDASLSYGLTAYGRIDHNSVTDVARPLGGGVVLLTKANLPKSLSAGLDFNASGKLTRQLSYSLSGVAFYAQIDASALGTPGLSSTVGVNLKASLEYRPTPLDTAQISMSRTDRRLTPQGFVGAINLVNLGYKRQLRPDLALVVTISDVLDGQRLNRLTGTPQLRDDYTRYQFGQIAYVGVVYTFGRTSKAKSNDFDYGQ